MTNSQKGFLMPLLILNIALAILVLLGGVYLLRQPTTTAPIVKVEATPTPTPIPTDPTLNWHSYINTEYGLSFKTPEYFEQAPSSSNGVRYLLLDTIYGKSPLSGDQIMLTVQYWEKTIEGKTVTLNNLISDSTISGGILTTFDDQPAYEIKSTKGRSLYIENNGQIIFIVGLTDRLDTDVRDLAIIDLIFTTINLD